jgi:hypothetical protein
MVASIIRIQSALKFLLHQILICCCRFQIFGLCRIFKESVSYLYVVIFPCILVTRDNINMLHQIRVFKTEIAGIALSVERLARGWTTEGSDFESR